MKNQTDSLEPHTIGEQRGVAALETPERRNPPEMPGETGRPSQRPSPGGVALNPGHRTAILIVGVVLMAVLVAFGSFWTFRQVEMATELREHSALLIGQANALLTALVDAETAQRGYALTGEEDFLEPYLVVRERVRGQLEQLRLLTAIPAAQQHLVALVPLVDAHMQQNEKVIALRRNQNLPAATALVATGEGKRLMDAIRTEIASYLQIEEGARALNEVQYRSRMRLQLTIIVSASGLTLFLALACIYMIQRETQTRLTNLVESTTQRSLEIQANERTDLAETRTDEANARTDEANARNENTRRATELRYRRLFETAQDGILILDAGTGQVVDANPFMKELLGYSQEEFVGRKLWEIGPFKGEDASKNVFAGLQVNDRLHYEGLPLETKDGRRVEVEFISNAYLVDSTRLIHCNIRDITERMRVSQALATANKELAFQVEEKGKRADELAAINAERLAANEELAFQIDEKGERAEELIMINGELARSNAELEQFAYVATHDLQEPLRAVASCVQLLKKRYGGQLDARADEFIAHAVDGTKRMQTLINDLLGYSRISTHAQLFAQTDCGVVLDEALANLMVSIGESGAVVTRDVLPTVSGDATQLAQLFQNLIGNALKFRGGRSPRIHVGAKLVGNDWSFAVADNGIGMEPQYFERVFLVFQRLHTREEYQGTGIGLAICKKVVERHGGRIWVESEFGQGTTFCFTIPERK
ncbi:MAG: CHASE3 domain-containing protein [Chthoniobacter sp.]|uniref:sensor histidine kinase n=1 Tax=Chthoniobacter sp. TaxID=2510640 RepID=UPI0032AA90C4